MGKSKSGMPQIACRQSGCLPHRLPRRLVPGGVRGGCDVTPHLNVRFMFLHFGGCSITQAMEFEAASTLSLFAVCGSPPC